MYDNFVLILKSDNSPIKNWKNKVNSNLNVKSYKGESEDIFSL